MPIDFSLPVCYAVLTMVKIKQITEKHREKFAEKVMDWGNLVFVGLVIAQIVPGTGIFRTWAAISGVVSFAGAYLVAYLIFKGGED